MGRKRSAPTKVAAPKLTNLEAVDPPQFDKDPVAAKLWAKAAWFTERYTNKELADLINCSVDSIRLWVRGHNKRSGWLYEKEKYEKNAIRKSVVNNSVRMDNILTQMLDVFEKGIKEIKDSNAKLSVQEMSALSNSFDRLFKARQLSLGAPTDIFMGDNGKALTWTQIKEQMQDVDILDYSLVPDGKGSPRGVKHLENCADESK